MTTRYALVPVRLRETLGRDGRSAAHPSVFCPVRGRSVDVAGCAACPRLRGIRGAGGEAPSDGASLVCEVETRAAGARPSAVVELSAPRTACIRPDVALDSLDAVFAREHADCLPVVDEEGALLGVVRRGAVTALDPLAAGWPFEPAVGIHEATPLRVAARMMVRLGARSLVVVDDARRVVGLLSDLALLRAFRDERATEEST